jgi:hypothetical protein
MAFKNEKVNELTVTNGLVKIVKSGEAAIGGMKKWRYTIAPCFQSQS